MRKEYRGAAVPTTITGTITAGATSFTVAATTGWPDGSIGPFVVTLERGTANEEKILCTNRVGTTVNVTTRGYDGTTAVGHNAAVSAEHTIDATSMQEFSDFINLGGSVAGGISITSPFYQGLTLKRTGDANVTGRWAFGPSFIGTQRLLLRRENDDGSVPASTYGIAFHDDGTIRAGGDGTVAAPTYGFANETNTGFYRSASGEIAISAVGVRRIAFSSDGGITGRIGQANGRYELAGEHFELGNGRTTTGSSQIDMHAVPSVDFSVRIQAISGAGGAGTGDLSLQARSVIHPNGSAANPGMAFGETNTGFYLPNAGAIIVDIQGSARYVFGPDHFRPTGNGIEELGTSANRWEAVWGNAVRYTSLVNDSDRRLKINIKPMELGLDFINLLNPVSFSRVDTDGLHYGLIAQEVEGVLQELGIENATLLSLPSEDHEYYGLDYTQFITPLVRSVQQLSTENKELRQRIEALESRPA